MGYLRPDHWSPSQIDVSFRLVVFGVWSLEQQQQQHLKTYWTSKHKLSSSTSDLLNKKLGEGRGTANGVLTHLPGDAHEHLHSRDKTISLASVQPPERTTSQAWLFIQNYFTETPLPTLIVYLLASSTTGTWIKSANELHWRINLKKENDQNWDHLPLPPPPHDQPTGCC